MRYHELVIEAPRGWGLGFLQGFLSGGGIEHGVFDAEEEGFNCEPLREQIQELIRPAAEVLHLLAPAAIIPRVRRAAREATRRGRKMDVRHTRPLAGARFTFEFSIYSREHAIRIRHLFDRLGRGVHLIEGSRFDEIRDPDARGLEMYAPVHHYELHGKGGVEGEVEALLPIYRICREEDLIRTTRAELIGVETERPRKGKKRR